MNSTPRLVDPFMPLRPQGPYRNSRHRNIRTTHSPTSMTPRTPYGNTPIHQSAPTRPQRKSLSSTYLKRNVSVDSNPKRSPRLNHLYLILVPISAIIVGLFAQSLVFGEILVAAYAIAVVVKRISSSTTFLITLATVACTIITYATSNYTLAATLSAYVLLLLIIGTATLGYELRQDNEHYR